MNILIKYKNLLIETLKENKKLIGIIAALYFIIVIVTYFYSINLISSNYAAFKSSMAPGLNTTVHTSALDLFLNNSRTVLLNYILGIFFGIFPIISILTNSFALGAQAASFGFIQANGTLRYILYLIPHGIFEITGTILESVAGIILFKFVWRLLKDLIKGEGDGFKEKLSIAYQNNKRIFIQSFVLMIFCIILMLIAAPIEYYISKAFCNLILGPEPPISI